MNVEDPYMKFESFSAACRRLFRPRILSRSVVLGLLTMWTLQSTGGPPYNEGRALRGSLPALSKEQKRDGKVLIEPRPKVQARLAEAYGRLPLSFEPNDGQAERKVKFLSRGPDYTLFLTPSEAVFSLRSQEPGARSQKQEGRLSSLVPGHSQRTRSSAQGTKDKGPGTNDVLRMKLVGANQAANVTALDELPGKTNYFIGNDSKKWRTDVPTYGKVKYEGVYPGIDLVYYGNQRQLEYDFVVAPGADPKAITLAIENRNTKIAARQSKIQNRKSKIDWSGDLVVEAEDGEIRLHKPVVYQPAADAANPKSKIQNRKLLEGRYVLTADNQIHFEISN